MEKNPVHRKGESNESPCQSPPCRQFSLNISGPELRQHRNTQSRPPVSLQVPPVQATLLQASAPLTQLLHTLRSLPTARPSRAVRLATLVLSLTIGVTGFFQAVSHPDGYLPLHIAFFTLITLCASLYYTAYRHSVYALCTLILLSSAYYNQVSALLALYILASTFLFVLTGPLPGIVLLAISHTAGEIITAYALQQPFSSSSLIFSLTLFIALPLALRISWEQKKTLAQEYADYKEQVAESNRALARELHDTVARHISVIGLTTGQGLDATDPSSKDAALHTIEEHTHKALTDMRLLIRTTRGDADPTALPQTSTFD